MDGQDGWMNGCTIICIGVLYYIFGKFHGNDLSVSVSVFGQYLLWVQLFSSVIRMQSHNASYTHRQLDCEESIMLKGLCLQARSFLLTERGQYVFFKEDVT